MIPGNLIRFNQESIGNFRLDTNVKIIMYSDSDLSIESGDMTLNEVSILLKTYFVDDELLTIKLFSSSGNIGWVVGKLFDCVNT